MNNIKISKSEQFYYENRAWVRSLDFYKLENTFLKTRLSEVVDQRIGKEFLPLAEHFQNEFIIKDEFIQELIHDSNHQQRQLEDGLIHDKELPDNKTIKKQDKLRNEIEYLEKDFARLRNEFNKYLAAVL
jgi:hypothetical protein